jgi:hypothetical protein
VKNGNVVGLLLMLVMICSTVALADVNISPNPSQSIAAGTKITIRAVSNDVVTEMVIYEGIEPIDQGLDFVTRTFEPGIYKVVVTTNKPCVRCNNTYTFYYHVIDKAATPAITEKESVSIECCSNSLVDISVGTGIIGIGTTNGEHSFIRPAFQASLLINVTSWLTIQGSFWGFSIDGDGGYMEGVGFHIKPTPYLFVEGSFNGNLLRTSISWNHYTSSIEFGVKSGPWSPYLEFGHITHYSPNAGFWLIDFIGGGVKFERCFSEKLLIGIDGAVRGYSFDHGCAEDLMNLGIKLKIYGEIMF